MRVSRSVLHRLSPLPPWLWPFALAALVIHGGTALLRLNTFFPQPFLIDLASFYAGAWAIRLGMASFEWDAAFTAWARENVGPGFSIPLGFPLWLWLLQPLTYLPYGVVAWLWLGGHLLLLVWCTRELCRLARIDDWLGRAVAYGLIFTFGSVMLTLTIGQTSILLLTLALWIMRDLRQAATQPRAGRLAWFDPLGILLWTVAVCSKLFPLLWIPGLFVMGAWRALQRSLIAIGVMIALHGLLLPVRTWRYVTQFLPQRSEELTKPPLDDQSLVAWLMRMTQPGGAYVPGLRADQVDAITWTPPWQIAPQVVLALVALILLAGGLALAYFVWQRRHGDQVALFILWLEAALVVMPHTERYNHTLLLPALFWLWGRNRQGRAVAVLAYFLAALARLNHLWAQVLPAPWAPLLMGSGLFSVCLLIGGMAWQLRSPQAVPHRAGSAASAAP